MAFYLSPMVDVKETDLSLTIPSVATSIGCIVLRNTYRGQEMKTTFLSSEDDLIFHFGEPTADVSCYKDMLAASGFLKYGRKLYATRALSQDSTFAGVKVMLDGQGEAYSSPYLLEELTESDPDQFAEEIVDDSNPLWFIASSRGKWGNNLRVSIQDRFTQSVMISGGNDAWETYPLFTSLDSPLSDDYSFIVVVEEKEQGEDTWEVKETFNVSTKEKAIDDQGQTRFVENVINQRSSLIRCTIKDDEIAEKWHIGTATPIYLEDGDDGSAGVQDADIMDALDLYSNPEEIDVNMFIDSDKSETVKKYMNQICEKRKDCMAILDCPRDLVVDNRGNETTDLMDWRRGLGTFSGGGDDLNMNTSYSAVYANWMEVYDRYNRKYRWIPTSGHIGGVYARTDQTNDAWWAPAGLNRAIITSVRRLAWNPDLGKRDMLYKSGLNPIVSFAGQGKVVWGQKTMLDKNSAFNRVNVRRLFIVLEKAISTASKYFLFEPNDTATRESMVAMIVPFLRDVQGRRGIYDFKVVCDETNNSPERIDRNEMWVSLYIKPTRTAEFIVLNFIAMKTGASFSEAAAFLGEV